MCTTLKTKNEKKKEAGVDTCWHVAALGFLVSFLATASQTNSAFFYVGFMEQFDVNRETATWPGSIITALSHLAAIFVALFQRRVSLFTIFLLGALLTWSGIVASAFVPNMAWMTVTFGAIHGLGFGFTTLTYSILLAMYFDKYRGLTSGMKFSGGSFGGLVFPKFLSYLQREYSFRGTLLIFGGISIHLSAIGVLVKEPPWTSLKKNGEGARNSTEECLSKIQIISADSEQLQQASTTPAAKQLKKHRPALRLLLNPMIYVVVTLAVVTDFTGAAFVTTLVDYALDKGLSTEDAESLIMYGSCSQLVGRLFLPLMADTRCFRRSTLVMASFFIWGCSVIAMPYATLRVHIIVLSLSVYLFYGCLQSMRSVLMADYIGVQWISTCYGLSGLFLLPLAFCSPSITGFFRDFHGTYDGLYMFHGGIQLAASALFLAVVYVERRNTNGWTLSRST